MMLDEKDALRAATFLLEKLHLFAIQRGHLTRKTKHIITLLQLF